METSSFDADLFLQSEVKGKMETSYTPIPSGDYSAIIDDLNPRLVNGQPLVEVLYHILDEELATKLDMEKIIVRQGLFVDANDDGSLQFGPNKNVKLGRLREALGQNTDKPWNWAMLKGAGPVTITVSQREGKDPGDIFNDVKKVARPTS